MSLSFTYKASPYYLYDILPGASMSCAMRKTNRAYGGPCLKVRRSSDDTALDIGFAGDWLSEAALLGFVGAGDGFLERWYDQGGAPLKDFVATVLTHQPQIVSAGVINKTIGNRPCLDFNGTTNRIQSGTTLAGYITTTSGTIATLFQVDAINTNAALAYDDDALWCNTQDQVGVHLNSVTPSIRSLNDDGTVDIATKTVATGATSLHIWRHSATDIDCFLNTTTPATTASGTTSALTTQFRIGANYNSLAFFDGKLSEIVSYSAILTATQIALLGSYMTRPYGIGWA